MHILKNLLQQSRTFLAVTFGALSGSVYFGLSQVAHAQGAVNSAKNFLDRAQSTGTSAGVPSGTNAPVNAFSDLYSRLNANLGSGGTDGFLFILNELINTAINLVSLVAVVFVLAAGIQMVINSHSEEQAKKQTVVIFNIIIGIVIMNVARFAVVQIAPDTSTRRVGEILNRFDSLDNVRETAVAFSTQVIFPLIDFALSFLAGIAILYIVYAGLSIILARGEEDKIAEARSRIIKVVVGVMVILLNKSLVGIFYGSVDTGVSGAVAEDLRPDLQQGIDLAFNLANYALSFMGIIAIVALIYGGVLIATGGGDESKRAQGLKILQYVFYGIIMAMSAYTLTSAIIGATIRAA